MHSRIVAQRSAIARGNIIQSVEALAANEFFQIDLEPFEQPLPKDKQAKALVELERIADILSAIVEQLPEPAPEETAPEPEQEPVVEPKRRGRPKKVATE